LREDAGWAAEWAVGSAEWAAALTEEGVRQRYLGWAVEILESEK
jgi:hypothetical protein